MGLMTMMARQSSYSLVFGDGAVSTELDAWDRASAFETAQRMVRNGRGAVLLEDGEPIASLSYSPEGFWSVSEPSAAA